MGPQKLAGFLPNSHSKPIALPSINSIEIIVLINSALLST